MTKRKPQPFVAPPDRPDTLPMGLELQTLADAVERIGPARARHSGRNAFNHLHKAWKLHPIDSEMSLFCALTAEEEAASALILALRQQRYPGAKLLDPQSHMHKGAIWPIIEAIARGHTDKGLPPPVISVSRKGRALVSVKIDIGPMIGHDGPYWAHSPDPFHFVLRSDENGPFETHRWTKELGQISGAEQSIIDHIRTEANIRNRLLYATDKGMPGVEFPDASILLRLERVKWIMIAVIGILQTKTKQLLVVQALEALLMALRKFKGEGYEFPGFEGEIQYLSIKQQPDGSFLSGFSIGPAKPKAKPA